MLLTPSIMAKANIEDPFYIAETITYRAPCPCGLPDVEWRSMRYDTTDQRRTRDIPPPLIVPNCPDCDPA